MAIISAIDHPAIQRLEETWKKVPIKLQKDFEGLKEWSHPNQVLYKQELQSSRKPCVPYM
jgi:hypothetical protein